MENPMTTRSDFNRSAASRLLVLSATLCALLHVASGCAFSSRVQTPRSSWEQILATTAIDRALKQVEWPEVDGKSVFVEVGPPGDVLDDLYLQRSIEVSLADRGAQIARNAEGAEYVLTCLVGAIGLDISGRFLGLQGSSGGILHSDPDSGTRALQEHASQGLREDRDLPRGSRDQQSRPPLGPGGRGGLQAVEDVLLRLRNARERHDPAGIASGPIRSRL